MVAENCQGFLKVIPSRHCEERRGNLKPQYYFDRFAIDTGGKKIASSLRSSQ
jgi:hypothetical protein